MDRHEQEIITQQAVKFWNSPWAMQSEWNNGRGVSARFFVANDMLELDVTLRDGAADAYVVSAAQTELKLHAGDADGPLLARIPLPNPVQTYEGPVNAEAGHAHIALRREGLGGQLT